CRWGVSARRRTWRARSCSSPTRRPRSSPGRLYSSAAGPPSAASSIDASAVSRSGGQQLFEETADFARPIDEVNLEDPMAQSAVLIRLAQRQVVAGPDRKP